MSCYLRQSDPDFDPLATLDQTLRFAVPLSILEIRTEMDRITDAQRYARMSRCATTVGSHGDALQWPSPKWSKVAIAALIEGIAMGAYEPHGISWRGQHWCVRPHAGCPRRDLVVQQIGGADHAW
jgi:hypothetical protein